MRSVRCTSILLKIHFEGNEGSIMPTNVALAYLLFFFFLHLFLKVFCGVLSVPYCDTACLFVTGSEYSSKLVFYVFFDSLELMRLY